jgi:hypothetical protein
LEGSLHSLSFSLSRTRPFEAYQLKSKKQTLSVAPSKTIRLELGVLPRVADDHGHAIEPGI